MSSYEHIENGLSHHVFLTRENKPSVFLIGDSVRLAYCSYVKDELKNEADVFYPRENCRSTQFVISSLFSYSNQFDHPERVKLLLFNCGHWDVAHWSGLKEPLTTLCEYSKNIRMIVELSSRLFINAKVVFLTTTAMNPRGTGREVNPRTNEEISTYNKAACLVAQELDVPVIDLYTLSRSFPASYFVDYCHPTPDAAKILAEAVSSEIKKRL